MAVAGSWRKLPLRGGGGWWWDGCVFLVAVYVELTLAEVGLARALEIVEAARLMCCVMRRLRSWWSARLSSSGSLVFFYILGWEKSPLHDAEASNGDVCGRRPLLGGVALARSDSLPRAPRKPLVRPLDQTAAVSWRRSLFGGVVLLLEEFRWHGSIRRRLLLWVWASMAQCTPSRALSR
uniref:Uncharacterized protein n=1 Tax=Aegilops tauschii subsp. strangulata TaxID=200361 RepID=A0A452Z4N6_AEGTS